MPGLMPGIHVFLVAIKEERRGWPGQGHDGITHAASVFSTSLIQYDVPNTIASSLKL
jgi:hypothetical protein